MKNSISGNFSHRAAFFQGFPIPEQAAELAGYSAIIQEYQLNVPIPDTIAIISSKHKRYQQARFDVFTPRHRPKADLYGHLVFALKYEGINLSVLSELFQAIHKNELKQIIALHITNPYARRLWFLYEWLTEQKLDLPDLADKKIKFVTIIDPEQQYPGPEIN